MRTYVAISERDALEERTRRRSVDPELAHRSRPEDDRACRFARPRRDRRSRARGSSAPSSRNATPAQATAGSRSERRHRRAQDVVGLAAGGDDAVEAREVRCSRLEVSSLERSNDRAKLVRIPRVGRRAVEVDENERLCRGDHQRVVGEAIRRALVGDARAPDPARCARMPRSGRRSGPERGTRRATRRMTNSAPSIEGASQMTVVLGTCVVEVRQVPAVVDDTLCVRVREPDPGERRVLERRPAVGHAADLGSRAH